MHRDVSRRGCSAYTSLEALSELFKNAPRCLHISALEFTAPAVRRRPLAERPSSFLPYAPRRQSARVLRIYLPQST
jgi:hypothetical protein